MLPPPNQDKRKPRAICIDTIYHIFYRLVNVLFFYHIVFWPWPSHQAFLIRTWISLKCLFHSIPVPILIMLCTTQDYSVISQKRFKSIPSAAGIKNRRSLRSIPIGLPCCSYHRFVIVLVRDKRSPKFKGLKQWSPQFPDAQQFLATVSLLMCTLVYVFFLALELL